MADKKQPAGFGTGAARAALGQGLMMGWGDEAEAWLKSKMGEGSYEDNLRKIRGEYGQFSAEHPIASGVAEFAGAAAPAVGAMFLPGGQALGATTGLKALAMLSAMGATQGAVSGAGSAEEGRRGEGAGAGAVIGGITGVAAPMALRGGSAGAKWLRDRLAPTEATIATRAAEKMTRAMDEGSVTPQGIKDLLEQDRALQVPSVVANVNPALVDLAEAVAQRTGKGARKVEETLTKQKLGTRERTYSKVQKNLNPGDYYEDLAKLQEEMRTRAGPLYERAYAHGEVTDPAVLEFLKLPQFKQAEIEARKLLEAEGRKLPSTTQATLSRDVSGALGVDIVKIEKPTVEHLDQIKRGLDALIEKETDAVTGKTTSLGRVYTKSKNDFLTALDAAVPDYELARGVYRGGAELQDAMRKGLNEFGKLDHEQVVKMVGGMSASEKEAFRTGVARDLYGKIMTPSGNFNAAQRLMSPEMQAKLQPLFDSPAQFNLFKSALERESQLFSQANKVLGGSQTGKRIQMRENLEETPGAGQVIGDALTGGFWNSLMGVTTRAIRNTQMPEKTAEKLSQMLMAKDPHEVAAVVKLLETHAAEAAPKAFRAGAAEAGATGGTTGAFWPSPLPPQEAAAPETIEAPAQPAAGAPSFSIEDAIRAEEEAASQK